jgi:hypothetical protein
LSAEHQDPTSGPADGLSEEELRARLEEELRRITVKDVLLQTVVTLINLAGQKLGLSETTRQDRDPEQTRLAIEAVRALLPVLEADPETAEQVRPVREALSQLQMAYAGQAGRPPEQRGPSDEKAEGGESKRRPGVGGQTQTFGPALGSARHQDLRNLGVTAPARPRPPAAPGLATAIDCRGFSLGRASSCAPDTRRAAALLPD